MPHSEEERQFVYSDSPRYGLLKGGEGAGKSVAGIVKTLDRLRRGMNGIMCCVAGETIVNGIPLAERTQPGKVDTLFGPALASTSFCEGQADLFRVVTQLGHEVVVTAGHRFLTPIGWCQLESLKNGDLIAFDDFQPKSTEELKVKFVQIKSITFQKYGEFYDLTVPSVGHYSAHGLYHHNSPDLPHFKKSLWPEFRLWCPIDWIIKSQRYRLTQSWQPNGTFELVFINGASLLCGGIENPGSWEGPNRSFWHLDEGRHAKAEALKVLDGRARIEGPNGEPPQGYITTTPKKNWLYEYFGPMQNNDKYAMFKNNSLVVTLPLELNKANLSSDYIEMRTSSLTASEARVRVFAEWEDESDTEKFINIFWWDACQEMLPPLNRSEPAVIALDAATGSETTSNLCDCFAVVLVTRHLANKQNLAVRYCGIWQPEPGKFLDFAPIEQEIIRLIQNYSIIEVCYDVTQLHDMATRLRRIANVRPFDQGKDRLVADKLLQARIMSRGIVHDGNPLLRQHMDNADIKKHGNDGIRLVKRTSSLKIDAAVAVSMAASRSLYYNIG